MHYEAVVPEHGTREHIIVDELSDNRVLVACGYDHFNKDELVVTHHPPSIVELEKEEAESICKNCLTKLNRFDKMPKRYWYET